MAKLVLFQSDGSTRDFVLSQERMTIGRRPDNDICLPNPAVSGEHAAVVTILADSFLEDLGSTNGTLVNGKAITKHFLRERDEIDVGRHRLVYVDDEAAALPVDIVAPSHRVAAGDLGRMVEKAKPSVRGKEPAGEAPPIATPPRTAETSTVKFDKPGRPNGNGYIDATARLHVNLSTPKAAPQPAGVAIGSVMVLEGAQAGRSMALTKAETTIGRAGVQVAVIAQSGLGFELRAVEGELPPRVNGVVVGPSGVALATGDAIEIAGSRLQFVGLPPSGA